MCAARQELPKGTVAATDGRRQDRKDSSRGESSKGESSKGESSKGESSKGESSKGESSKGASWLRLGKGKGETRGRARSLFTLYRESSHEESESEAAFEMRHLTMQKEDKEKPDGKEKKKADKGKAVYRSPWVAHNQEVGAEKKRREVEPSKFVTKHPSAHFKNRFDVLLRLTQDGQSKTKARARVFWAPWQS